MKANKITLKKIRLEYLERIVDDLQSSLDYRRDRIEEAKEGLEEVVTAIFDNEDESAVRDRDRNMGYYNDIIARYEMEVKEGEKLLAELEKMV